MHAPAMAQPLLPPIAESLLVQFRSLAKTCVEAASPNVRSMEYRWLCINSRCQDLCIVWPSAFTCLADTRRTAERCLASCCQPRCTSACLMVCTWSPGMQP